MRMDHSTIDSTANGTLVLLLVKPWDHGTIDSLSHRTIVLLTRGPLGPAYY